MSDITTRTETLGSLAARQSIVIAPLAAAISEHGEHRAIVSRTKVTPFGNFLLGWELDDAAPVGDFDCCLNGEHAGDPAIQHDGARQAVTDAALAALEVSK